MLWIRERPPLRLTTNVRTPSGTTNRWATDDPDPANQPQNQSFGTSMPGGFADHSVTLARNPRRDYPDLEELSTIQVRGAGGVLAWEGRLEQLPDTGGSQSQISPQCVGWQSHLDDNSSAAMIYVDQQQSTWQSPPLDRQILLTSANLQLASNTTAADPDTQLPAIVLSISDSWSSPWTPDAEAWYDSGTASPIAKVYYSYTPQSGVTGGSWGAQVFTTPNPDGSGAAGSANLAAGATSGYFTPTTPSRYALLQFRYGSSPAGADGATYNSYWRPAVYGNHNLPLYGPDPGGVLASDVVAHALRTWAPKIKYTLGTGGSIQPSQFVIPQLAFTTPGTASAIIKQAVEYELLDWAVWDGPTFYLNQLGKAANARHWRSRIGECQLQETGANVSRIWNGVIVQYQTADGGTSTVGPPGSNAESIDARLADPDPLNPANQAGITRWTQLQMQTTTLAGAVQVGGRFLQAQKTLDMSGQASLVGHVQDDRGVWWPAYMMRAGDTLSVVDARDASARRIVSTSYDDSSKTNSVQLDQPPDGIDALLDRLSVVLAPLGVS